MDRIGPPLRGGGVQQLRRILAEHGHLLMIAGVVGVIFGGAGMGELVTVTVSAKILLAYVMWMVIAPPLRGGGVQQLRRILAEHGHLLMIVGAVGVIFVGAGMGEPVTAAAVSAKILLAYVMWTVGCGSVLLSMLLP